MSRLPAKQGPGMMEQSTFPTRKGGGVQARAKTSAFASFLITKSKKHK